MTNLENQTVVNARDAWIQADIDRYGGANKVRCRLAIPFLLFSEYSFTSVLFGMRSLLAVLALKLQTMSTHPRYPQAAE